MIELKTRDGQYSIYIKREAVGAVEGNGETSFVYVQGTKIEVIGAARDIMLQVARFPGQA